MYEYVVYVCVFVCLSASVHMLWHVYGDQRTVSMGSGPPFLPLFEMAVLTVGHAVYKCG